jgi:hypothetical protein
VPLTSGQGRLERDHVTDRTIYSRPWIRTESALLAPLGRQNLDPLNRRRRGEPFTRLPREEMDVLPDGTVETITDLLAFWSSALLEYWGDFRHITDESCE